MHPDQLQTQPRLCLVEYAPGRGGPGRPTDARSVVRSMRRAADRSDTPAEARQILHTEAVYLAGRRAMLTYPARRAARLPVVVEAAAGKRPGMSRRHTGVAGTLALRLHPATTAGPTSTRTQQHIPSCGMHPRGADRPDDKANVW
jgi:hypothetical protein